MPSASTASLKLDPETKARIQRLADAQRRTSHWIMREAIQEYITRQEKRESFLQDARDAWQHYQDTGLHLTDDEVGDWIAKLEAGEAAELPECHV